MNYILQAGAQQKLVGSGPSRVGRPLPSSGCSISCVASTSALPLQTVNEERVAHFSYDRVKAITTGVGFVVGDVFAQCISGSPNINIFRSAELGAIGAGLDAVRQQMANPAGKQGLVAEAANTISNQAVWAPIVASAMYAVLKVVEGQPGDILQGIEDKMTAMVVANYVLWPITCYLNNTFVPPEHRVAANHTITVVWNAWLSTLGHAPAVNPADLLHSFGGHTAVNAVSEHVAPALAHVGAAVGHTVNPFLHQATQGLASLADRMPSCLMDKAFSKSLDVLLPFCMSQRSPSQLLEAAASISLDRAATLELVLDRLQSSSL